MEEQSKLTTLLEKILTAFEGSTQSNLRSGEDGDDIDDEKLPKKIDNLIDIVEGLRKEIAEFKADQGSIEVTNDRIFPIFHHFTTFFFFSQLSNQNLVAHTEKLLASKKSESEFITKKLEHIDSIAESLNEIKSDIKSSGISHHGAGGGSGLSEHDRSFLKELTNETRDAIQDMRLEVLTASDKSERKLKIEFFHNSNACKFPYFVV